MLFGIVSAEQLKEMLKDNLLMAALPRRKRFRRPRHFTDCYQQEIRELRQQHGLVQRLCGNIFAYRLKARQDFTEGTIRQGDIRHALRTDKMILRTMETYDFGNGTHIAAAQKKASGFEVLAVTE